MRGVVFPGKEFMIEKYGLQSKEQIEVQRRSRPSGRAKIKDGKKGEVSSSELRVTSKKKVSSSELRVTSKTSELRTPYSELNFGGCGIHIVDGLPSANGRQVRAVVGLRRL